MDPAELTAEELTLLIPEKVAEPAATEVESDRADWAHGSVDLVSLRRQLEVMEAFHQEVAIRFADTLSRTLQRLVEVQLTHVESTAYSQFAFSRTNPTCYVVLSATPLPTPLALDVDPAILYPILDCLLGGGHQPCTPPERPPTELEHRLASTIVRSLLDELHDAWEPLLAVDLSIDRIESNAQRVRVVAPGEAIVTLVFKVEVADQTGEMTFCLPCRAIRKIVDKLLVGEYHPSNEGSTLSASGSDDKTAVWGVHFEGETMSSVDLQNLRVGDVILSEIDVDGLVSVTLNGQPVGRGKLGSVGDQRAVEIVP